MANFDSAFDKMIRNEGGFKLTHIEGDRAGQGTNGAVNQPGVLVVPRAAIGRRHEADF